MTDDFSFRDDPAPMPAAQAQAALLLTESLIHALLDGGVLSKAATLDVVRAAMDVKEESAPEGKEPRAVLDKSVALLAAMLRSIEAHGEGGR